ncbi:MAG: hypothetical protein ACI8XQ_001166 [Bermanella sp.]
MTTQSLDQLLKYLRRNYYRNSSSQQPPVA